jgi:hypothetical protein
MKVTRTANLPIKVYAKARLNPLRDSVKVKEQYHPRYGWFLTKESLEKYERAKRRLVKAADRLPPSKRYQALYRAFSTFLTGAPKAIFVSPLTKHAVFPTSFGDEVLVPIYVKRISHVNELYLSFVGAWLDWFTVGYRELRRFFPKDSEARERLDWLLRRALYLGIVKESAWKSKSSYGWVGAWLVIPRARLRRVRRIISQIGGAAIVDCVKDRFALLPEKATYLLSGSAVKSIFLADAILSVWKGWKWFGRKLTLYYEKALRAKKDS